MSVEETRQRYRFCRRTITAFHAFWQIVALAAAAGAGLIYPHPVYTSLAAAVSAFAAYRGFTWAMACGAFHSEAARAIGHAAGTGFTRIWMGKNNDPS